MADIRVHIDTLEYTRNGLKTKQPIPLQVGEHNRVVLVRPDRAPAFAASHGGFGPNSTFPGPAVLSLLLHTHRLGAGEAALGSLTDKKIQVFGHADGNGSDSDNKSMSERRADVVQAWLNGDAAAMLGHASDGRWGPVEQQVMLRSLGCDPGPIDGVFEVLTEAAVTRFQERYNDLAYHHNGPTPLHASLEVDGDLGPVTHEALVDAYTMKFSPRVPPDAYAEPGAAHGCGAFNAASPDRLDAVNRRVALVVHSSEPAFPEAAPCTRGNPEACAVVDEREHSCMWYREHVTEGGAEASTHHHYAGSWLRLTNGHVLLSVLTTVSKGEALAFTVREEGGEALADLKGTVQHGVGQVVWDPPEHLRLPDELDAAPGGPYFDVLHESTSTTARQPWCLGGGAGTVVLHTDIEHEYAADADVDFTLIETSGRYSSTLRPEADGVSDRGHTALYFESLPEDGVYTLLLRDHTGAKQPLFEDIAFNDIEQLGADDPDDIVDPFTLEPVQS